MDTMTAAALGADCNISIRYLAEVLAFRRGCFDSCCAATPQTMMVKAGNPA
jgi:hypothetical protein